MIEITGLASALGPLTKRISLGADGRLISDGSACVMGRGAARRVRFATIGEFADLIHRLEPSEAIALGSLRSDLPDQVEVVTAKRLRELNGEAPSHFIARTAGHIAYNAGRPALALLDFDTKGMPKSVAEKLASLGGFWSAVTSVLPDIATAGHVMRRSTSSGISRQDTGQPVVGSDGIHVFVAVQDGADIERFLKTLHDRCWLAGLGWMMIGAGGQLLERSIVDRMVGVGERLVFEGAPILEPPLLQDRGKRAPVAVDGPPLDTAACCHPLTLVEKARLKEMKAQERHRLGRAADEARAEFTKQHAERIAQRTGAAIPKAQHIVARQCEGVLLPDVVLPFDAEEFTGCTVGQVLADPDRFVGATMADPLEGTAYGTCKAKLMRREDGAVWIHSFAHGRTVYEMRYDFASIHAALSAADPAETANVLVRMLLAAELAADEEQTLREFAIRASGVKARPLGAKIKAAREEQAKARAEAERDSRATVRTDKRLQVPAPLPDAERLPVLQMLDDVLGGVADPEPPMRNLDGHPVEVRTRPPLMLHELTSAGANQGEAVKTRLPPPEMPLLTKHDRFSLAHAIERHIEFTVETKEGERSVALSPTFVDHYSAYRDSRLPRVGAVVTAPLVLPQGDLLAPVGLDRQRKVVFRIEPRLIELMPVPGRCTKQAAANALHFLVSQWLCDVAADFAGKCVLIALALTILERVLLPERPAFFVTAGKRGGGKTTAIMMIILAVTGKKPPAAAWSPNEEERRKAILAYLAEGLAALVWDNIPLGTAISCPTLEKVLTAESYSDRILGETANLTVPSFTVMAFTGNNIGPKGDMASRSLVTRLEVDRPDPENRTFTHADPVAWTLENRGLILRALYTVLLSNPQLNGSENKVAKTRFKSWWHLVGSAIENGAATLVDIQAALDKESRYASKIDFNDLFAEVEAEDEEAAGVAETLEIIDARWPARSFRAQELATLINDPPEGAYGVATRLRTFFELEGRKASGNVSAIAVSRRLSAITGAPVRAGNRMLKLTKSVPKNQAEQRHTASFCVLSRMIAVS